METKELLLTLLNWTLIAIGSWYILKRYWNKGIRPLIEELTKKEK